MENRAENGKHKNLCTGNIIYLKMCYARNDIFYGILNTFQNIIHIISFTEEMDDFLKINSTCIIHKSHLFGLYVEVAEIYNHAIA